MDVSVVGRADAAGLDRQPIVTQIKLISFFIGDLWIGGAERQLVLLASRLKSRGIEVEVMVRRGGGPLETELVAAGVPVVALGASGSWSNVLVLPRLLRRLRESRPAVVHGYLPVQNLLLLASKPLLRRWGIAIACGVRSSRMDNSVYGPKVVVTHAWHDRWLHHANVAIFNSTAAARELANHLPAARIRVVPNGIDTGRFCFSESARAAWRVTQGVKQHEIAIGLVGRLDPMKNHRMLVAAASPLLDTTPNVRLLFVGAGPNTYRAQIDAFARQQGVAQRVTWVAAASDMAAVYSGLDILCLPSVSESFPNVLGEAMACGLPCVATDVGDVAEVLGGTGWIVPANQTRALGDALSSAIAALPLWSRERPRERIRGRYDVDALVSNTLQALSPWLRTP